MDALEKFYIFCETKLNNQINDKLTVKPNVIFDVIVRNDPHKGIHNTTSRSHIPNLTSEIVVHDPPIEGHLTVSAEN